ncbi:bZIP transcription factor 60 [Cryptomeria japonica]|uniref:bZIP transcription factor 60 n=1 Tax=Cryptomeria japonica TaxID=3369 RepID=UPI0025AC3CA9|nr:bZIP transcription factor 60 [Cryptomeria japonica]
MENEVFCEETEIDWEAVLREMPDSPGICLDDFLVEDGSTNFLLPSPDADGNGTDGLQSASEVISALTDLLFNDEDFQNSPVGDGGAGSMDINSFLADACSLPQEEVYVENSDDVNVISVEGQIQRGDDVEGCANVERAKNEGQILRRNREDEGHGEADAFTRKRKRNKESALKSRERKKAYEKSLEAKCRMLERKCGRLEQSLNYSGLENLALKNELFRVTKPYPHCHGGGAEPAVLLKDSLQKESLLCGMIMAVMMLLLFLLPHKGAVVVVVILDERESSDDEIVCRAGEVGFGVKRRWKWSRKKMKL